MGKRGLSAGLLSGIVLVSMILSACGSSAAGREERLYDLVVYTAFPEEIYRPVVEEFENRYQVLVDVKTETEDDILSELRVKQNQFPGDIVFGVTKELTEEQTLLFCDTVEFFSSRMVIAYNTKIVTYSDIPTDILSLAQDKWKGRIGFLNPEQHGDYEQLLKTVKQTYEAEEPQRLSQLSENLEGSYETTMDAVVTGMIEGKYPIGIIPVEQAWLAKQQGRRVAYLPEDQSVCTVTMMAAQTNQTIHQEAAEQFMTFISGSDVQRYRKDYLHCGSDLIPKEGGL